MRSERSVMPRAVSILVIVGWVSSIAAAAELDGQARHSRSLAATCANCHGNGAASDQALRPLELMPESAIVRAMQEYKSGARPGTVMPQLAKGYSGAQIAAIAAWYATHKP